MEADSLMSQDQRVARRALDARVRNIGGRQHVARGRDVYELSEVASRIWLLSDGSRTVDEIASAIVEEFDVDLGQAQGDVRAFIEQLTEVGLMSWVSA